MRRLCRVALSVGSRECLREQTSFSRRRFSRLLLLRVAGSPELSREVGAGAAFFRRFPFIRNARMLPSVSAHCCVVKAESPANNAQQLELWTQVTSLAPVKQAPALISYMDTATREICTEAESDVIADHDRMQEILGLLRGYFALQAAASCLFFASHAHYPVDGWVLRAF